MVDQSGDSTGSVTVAGSDLSTSSSTSSPMIARSSRRKSASDCPGRVRPSMSTSATPGITFTLEPARRMVGDAVLAMSAAKERAVERSGRIFKSRGMTSGWSRRASSGRTSAGWREAMPATKLRTQGVMWAGSGVRPSRATFSASLSTAESSRGIEPWPGSPRTRARTQQRPFSATWMG
jgi:hypothetical protein